MSPRKWHARNGAKGPSVNESRGKSSAAYPLKRAQEWRGYPR